LLTDTEFSQPLRHGIGAGIVELPPEPPGVDVPSVQIRTVADQPAYIYFTSGSTGRPKGVIDCHRNVLHNVMRYTRALNIEQADRLSLLQSCGFSGTVSSLFGALLNGATSCPMDMRAETPARVAQWLDELSVTIYHSVPSLFRSVVSAGQVFHHVRVVRLEGDRATRIDLELFRRHFTARSVLAVGLGTTETGLVCQYFFTCFLDVWMAVCECGGNGWNSPMLTLRWPRSPVSERRLSPPWAQTIRIRASSHTT
jgi:acyl-coenzyme A synthetase/AMP-(fatty) acid ligase